MMRLFPYKAALLQGKRPGRQFLFELQHQIHHHNRNYSKELLDEILDNIEDDKRRSVRYIHLLGDL